MCIFSIVMSYCQTQGNSTGPALLEELVAAGRWFTGPGDGSLGLEMVHWALGDASLGPGNASLSPGDASLGPGSTESSLEKNTFFSFSFLPPDSPHTTVHT